MYDENYYTMMYERNKRVANAIIPMLLDAMNPKSIVDIGCGEGIFLQTILEKSGGGIEEICGVDGDYVDRDRLLFPKEKFVAHDLNYPLKLDKRFDLAMTYEVAEHIAPENASVFVENMVNLSDVVAFSAAIPGQGGRGHINEQWPSYWKKQFEEFDYVLIDRLRENIWSREELTPLRRQNLLLFCKAERRNEVEACFPSNPDAMIDIVHPEVYLEKVERLSEKIDALSKKKSVLDKIKGLF